MKKQIITMGLLCLSTLGLAQGKQRLNVAGNLKADTLVAKVIKKDSGKANQILLADGSTTSTNGLITTGNQTFEGTKTFNGDIFAPRGFRFGQADIGFGIFTVYHQNVGTILNIADAGAGGGLFVSGNGQLLVYDGSWGANPAPYAVSSYQGNLTPYVISQGFIRANKNSIALDTLIAGKGIKLTSGKAGQVLLANGTLTGTGTTGQVLSYQGENAAPTWVSPGVVSSDRRLKTNIQPVSNAMATVNKLHAVRYSKKANMADKQYSIQEIGFIAQEVQKILPSLVSSSNDKDKLLSINYLALIPILTKALQEQDKRIQQLEAEVRKRK
jgi:hypothetical protein